MRKLVVETIAKIRREHHGQGKAVREIARVRSSSRNTVRQMHSEGLRRSQFRWEINHLTASFLRSNLWGEAQPGEWKNVINTIFGDGCGSLHRRDAADLAGHGRRRR
jgi:hypothetical protein